MEQKSIGEEEQSRYCFDHLEDWARVAANSLSRIRNSNCESRRL